MAAGDSMPFAREEGDAVVVAWDRVDVLIPESYFAGATASLGGKPSSVRPIAEDLGDVVETLGFFDVRAVEREGAKPRHFGVRLPARLRLRYSASSTETDADEEAVRVFTARAGELWIDDGHVVQSSDNVSEIFRVLASAKISGVAYTDLANMFIDGSKINGTNPGVTRSILEAIVSEMARWTKDPSVPLRIPLAAGRATEADFRFVKLKDLPRLNSVFTGIGFEDVQLAVQSGVRKTMSGEAQRVSPMEELVKY